MNSLKDCCSRGALVLAGGKSTRMKGSKALMKLNNVPLLLNVVSVVCELVKEVVVVIGKNDNRTVYEEFLPPKVIVVNDRAENKGPLMGMLTGFLAMNCRFAIVLPCDSPFVKREVINYLFDRARNVDAVIPRWPNGYFEPLHSVYNVSSASSGAESALRMGELMINDMIKRLDRISFVSIDKIREIDKELLTFYNINTQKDFEKAEEEMILK